MRLIDADAIAPKLEGKFNQDYVRYAPTIDAVPVVRCKDCIYYETGKDYLPYCNHVDGGISDYPRADDFCSYGERRSDD